MNSPTAKPVSDEELADLQPMLSSYLSWQLVPRLLATIAARDVTIAELTAACFEADGKLSDRANVGEMVTASELTDWFDKNVVQPGHNKRDQFARSASSYSEAVITKFAGRRIGHE